MEMRGKGVQPELGYDSGRRIAGVHSVVRRSAFATDENRQYALYHCPLDGGLLRRGMALHPFSEWSTVILPERNQSSPLHP